MKRMNEGPQRSTSWQWWGLVRNRLHSDDAQERTIARGVLGLLKRVFVVGLCVGALLGFGVRYCAEAYDIHVSVSRSQR